jgi:hypothetical protein
MSVSYRIEDNDLVVGDGRGVRWRGRPSGYPVEKVAQIPKSRDAVVLLRYWDERAPAQFANLLRVGPDGTARWHAVPPDVVLPDAWVAFTLRKRGGGLTANSWSCYFCSLDLETGAVKSSVFTK